MIQEQSSNEICSRVWKILTNQIIQKWDFEHGSRTRKLDKTTRIVPYSKRTSKKNKTIL